MKNDHLWSFFNIIYTFLGSILEPCYIQNHVITDRVIKRLKCISVYTYKLEGDMDTWPTTPEMTLLHMQTMKTQFSQYSQGDQGLGSLLTL